MGRVRVGILLEGTRCPSPLRTAIETLHGEPDIELILIRNAPRPVDFFGRITHTVPFGIVAAAERWILGLVVPRWIAGALYSEAPDATYFNDIIVIGHDDAAVEQVRGLKLDVLICGCPSFSAASDMAGATGQGLLSFDYDARRYPGFREVLARSAETGFAIDLRRPGEEKAETLLRSCIPTRRSFTETFAALRSVSAALLAQAIVALARTGSLPRRDMTESLPLPSPDAPGVGEMLAYIGQTGSLYAALAFRRLVLGQRQRWSVAYARKSWRDLSLADAKAVRNPAGRFFADPFVVTRNGKTALFVEDYAFATGRGTISAIVLDEDGGHSIVPDVVAEPFHLSYPFVFEFDGDLYMVPESHEAGSIRLYRCVRFPDRWEYRHDLMGDVRAADTMVLPHAGRWWLLTNIAPLGCDAFDAQLCAFTADSPLSRDWTPHPGNPVVLSSVNSRNGGFVLDEDGTILRGRQKQGFAQYGESLSLAAIVRLDESGYAEEFRRAFLPDVLPGARGIHHMHSDGSITVFDFVREERPDR